MSSRRAVELGPKNAARREILGRWLREEGDLDETIEQLQEIIRLNPKDRNAPAALAAVRQQKADRTAPPREVRR